MSSIEFDPAANGDFYIGDKVRVVLEGVITGYNENDGHYFLRGASFDRGYLPHVPWLHTLHWATEVHVLEAGPRNLGNGAQTTEAAFAAIGGDS